MAGRKRQPEKASNKDDRGATTGRPGTARDDAQRAGHADHGEPPADTAAAPTPSAGPDQAPAGRQPQRPGQDARFQEQPGLRDEDKVSAASSDRVSPPAAPPASAASITKKR